MPKTHSRFTADDLDLLHRWIAALESDDFAQTRGALTRIIPQGDFHCCLGVGLAVEGIPSFVVNERRYYGKDAQAEYLPSDSRLWDLIGSSMQRLLMSLNDMHGWTFPEIATFLALWIATDGDTDLFGEVKHA